MPRRARIQGEKTARPARQPTAARGAVPVAESSDGAGPNLARPSYAWSDSVLLDFQRLVGNAQVRRLVADRPGRVVQRGMDTAFTGSPTRPMVHPGDSGPLVEEVQTKLDQVGPAPSLTVTRHYDDATRRRVVAFQRSNGLDTDCVVGPLTWNALDRLTGTTPVPVGPDQHAGTGPPDAGQIAKVNTDLHPSKGGGPRQTWDGATGQPNAAANRQKLQSDELARLEVAFVPVDKQFKDIEALPRRLDPKKMEATGREAKSRTDALFGPLASASALTDTQRHAQETFDFTAGVNLFDAADTSARPPSAFQAAAQLTLGDAQCRQLEADHHLDHSAAGEEQDFWFKKIVEVFAGRHPKELERFDRFGFSSEKDGKVFAQMTLGDNPQFPDTPTVGAPSPAERRLKWNMFATLIHEYIHSLEHPAFTTAEGSNDIMREGFCEMFTEEVAAPAIGAALAGDKTVIIGVEGGDFPGFDPKLVVPYAPAEQYKDFVRQAKQVRTDLGAGGENAVRAAFFQGHVEVMGLKPDGSPADPVPAGADQTVEVPSVIRSVTGLAVLTGQADGVIQAANPTVPPGGPLPARMVVPGVRHHLVVEAVERQAGTGRVRARKAESIEQIATQNGVSPGDISRANPQLNHRDPKAGERLLIPVRV